MAPAKLDGQPVGEGESVKTLLTLPRPLYQRIKSQAKSDKRTVRPEIEILLEEAVSAREAQA